MASGRFALNYFHVPEPFIERKTPNSLGNTFMGISVMPKIAVFSTCC